MGRYYSGDIEGKFWFGVQGSDDASFFGGEESEPNFVNYYFTEEDLPSIKEGVEKCRAALGENKEKLDAFFEKSMGYTDGDVGVALGLEPPPKESRHEPKADGSVSHGWYGLDAPERQTVSKALEWYARLELGEKILKCVEEKGECSFEAEL